MKVGAASYIETPLPWLRTSHRKTPGRLPKWREPENPPCLLNIRDRIVLENEVQPCSNQSPKRGRAHNSVDVLARHAIAWPRAPNEQPSEEEPEKECQTVPVDWEWTNVRDWIPVDFDHHSLGRTRDGVGFGRSFNYEDTLLCKRRSICLSV